MKQMKDKIIRIKHKSIGGSRQSSLSVRTEEFLREISLTVVLSQNQDNNKIDGKKITETLIKELNKDITFEGDNCDYIESESMEVRFKQIRVSKSKELLKETSLNSSIII